MTFTKTVTAHGSWPATETLTQHTMKPLPHILIIDDDEIFVFLTRKMLQGSGLVEAITVCRSAPEAIGFLHLSGNKWPDLILLDLNMPEMNGWEFLQHYQSLIQHSTQHPRLFIISSSIAENDKERAKKIKGVDGYIAKPLTNEAVKQLIGKVSA